MNILFIGAHSDDVEIGSAGTLLKLLDRGHEIDIAILTDESDSMSKERRRKESIAAAAELGIQSDRVHFLGFEDGYLGANRKSVQAMRVFLRSLAASPDLVFTHTENDSHNDHRAAYELVLSAFREKLIMHYCIINSYTSEFSPVCFVDTSDYWDKKVKVLGCFDSQKKEGRILINKINELEQSFGEKIASRRSEGFEVTVQKGAERQLECLNRLSDCPFHHFWFSLIRKRKLINIHGVPVDRRVRQYDWQKDKDRDGMANLRRAFSKRWIGEFETDEYSCHAEGVESVLPISDVILSGGSVSNAITRTYFNHFVGIRYVIDYEMPDYKNIHVLDRYEDKRIHALYEQDHFGNIIPRIDKCILTVMRNPMNPDRVLLGSMGVHGFGTLGGYSVLTEPSLLTELLSRCVIPIANDSGGFQVLVDYDTRLELATILWDTKHNIGLVS